MKIRSRYFPSVLPAACVVALPLLWNKVLAADGTWTSLSTPGAWSANGNWSGTTVADGSGSTADFSTLNITADTTVRLDAPRTVGNLKFGDTTTGTAGSWILDNNATAANILTLAGTTPTITVNAMGTSKNASISAVIAGSNGLTKLGAGTLVLSGANTYSGGTTVTPTGDITAISAANSSAFGSGAVLLNGVNTFSGGISVTTGQTIANTLTMKPTSGRAVLVLNGTATWAGDITVDGSSGAGIAAIPGGGTSLANRCTISGNISHTGANANILAFRGSSQFGRVTGSISYGTGLVQLLDSTKWELENASNTWGTMDVSNASAFLYVNAANTLSSTGVMTSTATGTLKLNNMAATAAFDQSIGGLAGALKVGLDTGSATLTINTATDRVNTGVISGAISLVKSGGAIQTLSGINTYTGTTTINGGTLKIGSGGSINGSPSIILAGGTLDVSLGGIFMADPQGLSGNGAVSGAVFTGTSTVIRPGANTVAGTLAFDQDLNMTAGSTFAMSVGTSAVSGNSKVTVTGALNLSDTVFNINAADLMAAGGSLAPANYTLVSAGSISGAPSSTAVNWVGTPPANASSFTLVKSGNNVILKYATPVQFGTITTQPMPVVRGQSFTLTVAVSDPASTNVTVKVDATPIGGPAVVTLTQTFPGSGIYTGSVPVGTGSIGGSHDLILTATDHLSNTAQTSVTVNVAGGIWSGQGGGDANWSSATNWRNGTQPVSGESMIFAGSLPASLVSEMDGDYSISSLSFDSTAGAFTITDSSASHALSLSGGITNQSANIQTIDVPLVLSTSQSFRSNAGDLVINGEISGPGGFTLTGGHKLTLGGSNTYQGATTIAAGTLVVNNPAAIPFGAGKGDVNLNAGISTAGTLDLNGFNQTINGLAGSVDSVLGQVTNNFADSTSILTVGAGDASSSFGGILTDNSGVNGILALTKTGNGTLTLSNPNTYSGGTINSGGAIVCNDSESLGSGTLTCSGGQWVTLGSGVTYAHDIIMNAGGGNFSGLVRTAAGSATIEGGTITINGNPGSGGHLAAEGGSTLFVKAPITYTPATGSFIWRNGTGVFSGGGSYASMNVTGTIILGANNGLATNATVQLGVSGNATLDLAGFNQSLAGIAKGASAATIGNSSSSTDAMLTTTGTSSFGGVIQDSVNGGSMKTLLTVSSGSLTLSGASTYSGATTVNGGTLTLANATGSATGSSAVTVKSGASLSGTGSASGATTIEAGATLTPGTTAAGTLTLASATLAGAGEFQLDATTCGTLTVTGTLTISAGATINLSTLNTPTAPSYTLLSYGTLSGSLPTITGVPSGYTVDTATSGVVKLVQSGGGGFASWAASYPGLTDATPNGDPDHDGISNLLEYVIGGDPRAASTQFLPTQAIVGSNLVISYKRSDASELDTTQVGQWSATLANLSWANVTPVLVNENGSAPDDMTITIPKSNAVLGKLFGRLLVTQP